MSRPRQSRNVVKQPEIVQANEIDRLKYLAALLLEIAEEEMRESEGSTCNPN